MYSVLVYAPLLFPLFIGKSPVIPVKEVLLFFQRPLPNDDRQILMNKQNPKVSMVNVLQGVLKIGTNCLIMICLFSLLQECFQTTR